jgi:hypothetical protein
VIKNEKKGNNHEISRYAGIGAQFVAGILICLWLGKKTDQWLQFQTPVFIWMMPLFFITGTIIKLIYETGKKNKKNHV